MDIETASAISVFTRREDLFFWYEEKEYGPQLVTECNQRVVTDKPNRFDINDDPYN